MRREPQRARLPVVHLFKEATRPLRVARLAHNYKRMNELSKDAVAWLTIGVEAEGQRIDNFLIRTLNEVPAAPRILGVARRV